MQLAARVHGVDLIPVRVWVPRKLLVRPVIQLGEGSNDPSSLGTPKLEVRPVIRLGEGSNDPSIPGSPNNFCFLLRV